MGEELLGKEVTIDEVVYVVDEILAGDKLVLKKKPGDNGSGGSAGGEGSPA